VDALMGTEAFFLTMVDEPETIKSYIQQCFEPFFPVIDSFHQKLFANRQPSVTWIQIPSFEGMYIPSCDLGAMMSTEMFNEFSLPFIKKEVRHFRHNIFHVDGKGVAKHLDALMEIPEIQAFQWVQGVGNDRPIMQWVPLIQKIQAGGKSVVVDLHLSELDPFMDAVRPEGILICMDESSADTQQAVLEKLLTWK